MNKFKLTLNYDFNDDDYEYEVEVDAYDYADYLFEEVLSARRTDEAFKAVVEMIEELDLYEAVEEYGFTEWLTDQYREEAEEQYGYDRDANDVRGLYD